MNNKPLVRKIIYIALIGVLIIPLSFISTPETRNADGTVKRPGGVLAQIREDKNLSQAKMSEIDPASETMKLASLGLRGVAVNVLWMQAIEHRKNENYDELSSTLKLLTKIQPNFIKVWEYQAHNLAYNISMEFDDYEQRYTWVKRGLAFLKDGIPHNKRDHRMTDNMGFFTGNKFGKSDERNSYRRLFRTDNDFHNEMADRIDPELYDSRYGYDSWRMAYHWYDFSRRLVEEKNCNKYRSDVMFYMFRPSQLRQQAMSLNQEFPPSSFTQSIWRDADQEWQDYGDQKLMNSIGVNFTLGGLQAAMNRLEATRAKLDKLVEPGVRSQMIKSLANDNKIPAEDMALLDTDADLLSQEENLRVAQIKEAMMKSDQTLDDKIAMQAPEENRAEAYKLVRDIGMINAEIMTIDRDAQTVNYPYWVTRNRTESEDATLIAHQALTEAEEVWRKATYDDEYEFDYVTKEKRITRKGAIRLYEEAFALWKPILTANPRLRDGQLSDRLMQAIKEYQKMLQFSNREWPRDFVLQDLVDHRFDKGESDGIPTTIYMRQRDQEEMEDADTSDEIGGAKPKADEDDAEDEKVEGKEEEG